MAKLLLAAACALIDADGRVLLAQRPEGKPMSGLWEFPGGKIADGETPEAALARELKEELGVDVTPACLAPIAFASHDSGEFHLLMPLFVCRKWSGRPKPLEAAALAWVRPAALMSYDMPPADRPLAAQLRDLL
jgi:8-oxo-dGTP diphosphatase